MKTNKDILYCMTNGVPNELLHVENPKNEKFAYKDLDIGQFFYDTTTKHYGIKITSCRAYNIDKCRMYGFTGNHDNNSDYKHYLKCNYEVY